MSSRRGSHVLIHSNEMNDKMKTENNPQMKRRLSLRPSDRAQNESIAPLLALTDSILQNVPGSVAATPGDEISRQVFEKAYEKNSKEGETHPTQRPNLYRKDTTKFSSNTESVCNVPNGVALNAEVSVDSTIPLPPMTFTNPPKTIWRVIAVCILSFSGGVSDGAPGALLPYIEDYYKISYSVVSLIWMSTAIGFILVALFSHKITSWLGGIQRCITFGSMITSIMYIFVLTGSKFPLIVTGFFFGGVGLAINLSQMNIFLTGLEKSSTALGYCHGSYGFGASVSPLIATQFIDRGIPWHYFYLILLGLMLLNVVNCFFAFQGAAEDMAPWNEVSTEDSIEDSNTIKHDEGNDELINHNNETDIGMQNMGGSSIPERQPRPPSDMSLALKNRVTWLLSLFVLFYQGSEVSMGGLDRYILT